MPSHAMRNVIDGLREQRQAGAGQPPPTLAERRATFAPPASLTRCPMTCW